MDQRDEWYWLLRSVHLIAKQWGIQDAKPCWRTLERSKRSGRSAIQVSAKGSCCAARASTAHYLASKRPREHFRCEERGATLVGAFGKKLRSVRLSLQDSEHSHSLTTNLWSVCVDCVGLLKGVSKGVLQGAVRTCKAAHVVQDIQACSMPGRSHWINPCAYASLVTARLSGFFNTM